MTLVFFLNEQPALKPAPNVGAVGPATSKEKKPNRRPVYRAIALQAGAGHSLGERATALKPAPDVGAVGPATVVLNTYGFIKIFKVYGE